MKIHDVQQGSVEWLTLRLGIPTASRFSAIIQPKKLKYSESATGYRDELLAEWCMGYPIEKGHESGAMMRGSEMEEEARSWYEMHIDTEVRTVGFITRDDGRVGGSPDGLVGDDGGADFKCALAHNHIGYLLGDESPYNAQVQGYMYLTVLHWWDTVFYHPTLPRKIVHVERDENFIFWLHRGVIRFLRELEEGQRQLLKLGFNPPPWVPRPVECESAEAAIARAWGVPLDEDAMSERELDQFAQDVKGSGLPPERIRELLGLVIVGNWKEARAGWFEAVGKEAA